MSQLSIYVDKPYEAWTIEEKIEASNAVFAYLKHDGIVNPLDENKRTLQTKRGRRIQHVHRFVTAESGDMQYGFSDELVYVLNGETRDAVTGTTTQQKHFVGMHYNKSVDARLHLLDELDVNTIRCALFAVSMHEAE